MNGHTEKMVDDPNLDPAWGLILSVYSDHSEGIHLITKIDFMFHSEAEFVFVIVFVTIFVILEIPPPRVYTLALVFFQRVCQDLLKGSSTKKFSIA